MKIVRASDGITLTNHVTDWSDWVPRYSAPVIDTVMMVPYVQPIGVLIKQVTVKAVFADHYVGSSMTNFWALVAAHRRRQALNFHDLRGDVTSVRILEVIESEHEEAVKTKSIRYATIVLYNPAYTA